jgi:CheY-like chemotaxis protein
MLINTANNQAVFNVKSTAVLKDEFIKVDEKAGELNMKKRTVLFVDDDENMLRALKRALAEEPYEVVFVNNGEDALEILDSSEVQVIVADLHMPDMSGLQLLNLVKTHHPRVIRLILSGDTGADKVLDAINKGEVFRYIPKSCNIDKELKAIIRQAMDYYHLYSERSMLLSYIEEIIDGCESEQINLKLIKTLISDANRHLYEWCEDSSSEYLPEIETVKE